MNKEQYFQALELDAKRLSLEAFGQDAVNNLIYKYIPQTFENFLGYVNSFWLITKHKAIPDIYKSQERREFSKLVFKLLFCKCCAFTAMAVCFYSGSCNLN